MLINFNYSLYSKSYTTYDYAAKNVHNLSHVTLDHMYIHQKYADDLLSNITTAKSD